MAYQKQVQVRLNWRISVTKRSLAALLGLLLLGLSFGAADGPLHRALHKQGQDGSTCAICLFVKGMVDLPDSLLPVVLVFACLFFLLPALKASIPLSTEFLLPPERAPPRFSSVS